MPSKRKVFVLRSENLTGLGGPMGTEETHDNWSKIFSTLEKAQSYAEKDYAKESKNVKEPEKIAWRKEGTEWVSGDLRFVMYVISAETPDAK